MNFLERVYRKAALCRAFEEEVYRRVEAKQITCPVYLSAGQEYIPATIATWCEDKKLWPKIFIQHRGHSTYLCFGGDMVALWRELLGDKRGCAGGMGGSASIQHKGEPDIFGHDGLMGSQIPIAVGYCHATRHPTIVFAGDAAIEEDYALAALGWAATQKLPILFVVEDNGLSILTEKKVRRSWSIVKVTEGFGLLAFATEDSPATLRNKLGYPWPLLLNVTTTRLFWHAGAGRDVPLGKDRHTRVRAELCQWEVLPTASVIESDQKATDQVKASWALALEAAK